MWVSRGSRSVTALIDLARRVVPLSMKQRYWDAKDLLRGPRSEPSPASQRLPATARIVPPRTRKKLSDAEAIPIIFLHRSNSEYLKYTFAQAKAVNPKSDIVLLGDETNNQ